MHWSLFADNLAIYITTRNQREETKALQSVTNKLEAWTVVRGPTFSLRKMYLKKEGRETKYNTMYRHL